MALPVGPACGDLRPHSSTPAHGSVHPRRPVVASARVRARDQPSTPPARQPRPMPTLWPLRQRRVLRQHSRPRGWKHSIGCRLRSPSQHPTLDARPSIRCQFGSSWGPSRAHLWQRSRPRHSQHSGIRSHRCRYRRLAAAKPRRQQHASLHPAPACRPVVCTQPGLGQHNRPGRAHGSPVFCLRQHSESTTTGSTAGPNANSKQLSSGGWLIVAFRGTQQPSCGRLRLRTSAFGAHSTAAMIRPACCRLGSTWRPAVACGNTAALIRRRHAVTCGSTQRPIRGRQPQPNPPRPGSTAALVRCADLSSA